MSCQKVRETEGARATYLSIRTGRLGGKGDTDRKKSGLKRSINIRKTRNSARTICLSILEKIKEVEKTKPKSVKGQRGGGGGKKGGGVWIMYVRGQNGVKREKASKGVRGREVGAP